MVLKYVANAGISASGSAKGAWVDSISFYELAGEKERLVFRNPADIEREDGSVTSALSSFPVQMKKALYLALSEKEWVVSLKDSFFLSNSSSFCPHSVLFTCTWIS